MVNITKLSSDNKPLTFTFLAFFMIMGVLAYLNMPRNSMPPFLVRAVSIVTQFPGASPERIEALVTDKIEEAVQEIPEVDYISSESRTGISIITVAIKENETVLQPIFDDIRRKVESVQNDLPDGAKEPQVNDEFGDVFGVLVGLLTDGFTYAELKDMADDIRDEFIKLSDTAKVEIVGTQEERVFIDYDNARLADLGLTQSMIQNTLAATNIIYPGGEVILGHERIILEPTGNFESLADLNKTIITAGRGTQPLFLGDITQIYRGYIDPPDSIVRVNGQKGLVLGISLKEGGNIIDLGAEIDRKIEELKSVYPHGVDFVRVASQDLVVDLSVSDFLSNLIQSILVVLAVMLLFLGLRTGLVVASLIPMAIIMGLFGISLLGLGLDKVSLAALIIALGMLVDNAIVVSESIMVKMEEGEKPLEAAVNVSQELMIPLLISTLTTVAAFMPFYLAESVMGEIVGPIFIVLAVVLLSSWAIALTIIPLLCAVMIRVKKKKQQNDRQTGARKAYGRLLLFCLKRPAVLMIAIVLSFFAAVLAMKWLPFIFMPDDDRNLVYADIEMPVGTAIERTDEVVSEIEAFIGEQLLVKSPGQNGVSDWSSYTGKGAPKYDLGYTPSEGASHQSHLIMNTSLSMANPLVISKLETWCRERFPEIDIKVSALASGGGSADPVAIRISGKEPERLYNIVDQVKAKLKTVPGSKSIGDNWGMRTKKLVVDIDQTRAQMAGVSNQDVGVSLRTVLSGIQTSEFREGDRIIPIVMRNNQPNRMDIPTLESTNIFAQSTGKNVPLKQVADVEVKWQAAKIMRRDLYKTITVTSDVQPGFTAASIFAEMGPWLEEAQAEWGVGYRFQMGGESEDSSKAMNAVAVNLPTAFFAIVLLLVGQFNSFKKTTIVLLTIPLGFIGVVFGLLIGQSYLGFFSFLGIISLAGIVINNAIVLLDRIKLEIEVFKRPPFEAIIEAANQRFRPILLTTATTSLGLIPLWIGGGPMFQPMAIAIIFGLLFATVITLLFVPVLYKVFFRVSQQN